MKSNTNFRFSLGRRVGICPQCGHRTLKLYEDRATGWALDAAVGRCNREVKCKYHVTPAQYFAAGGHAPAVPAGWVAPPHSSSQAPTTSPTSSKPNTAAPAQDHSTSTTCST